MNAQSIKNIKKIQNKMVQLKKLVDSFVSDKTESELNKSFLTDWVKQFGSSKKVDISVSLRYGCATEG